MSCDTGDFFTLSGESSLHSLRTSLKATAASFGCPQLPQSLVPLQQTHFQKSLTLIDMLGAAVTGIASDLW